jgi:hypothetical protein
VIVQSGEEVERVDLLGVGEPRRRWEGCVHRRPSSTTNTLRSFTVRTNT